ADRDVCLVLGTSGHAPNSLLLAYPQDPPLCSQFELHQRVSHALPGVSARIASASTCCPVSRHRFGRALWHYLSDNRRVGSFQCASEFRQMELCDLNATGAPYSSLN